MNKTVSIILILVFILTMQGDLNGQSEKTREHQVKAVFLYNFANFVKWPDNAFSNSEDPIVICVLGKNPFGDILETVVEGETVGTRRIKITYAADLTTQLDCHILYTTSNDKSELHRIFKSIKGKNILTVGESKDFIRSGGTIGFMVHENKVQFEINMTAAGNAGLLISSKLQKVAKSIIRE